MVAPELHRLFKFPTSKRSPTNRHKLRLAVSLTTYLAGRWSDLLNINWCNWTTICSKLNTNAHWFQQNLLGCSLEYSKHLPWQSTVFRNNPNTITWNKMNDIVIRNCSAAHHLVTTCRSRGHADSDIPPVLVELLRSEMVTHARFQPRASWVEDDAHPYCTLRPYILITTMKKYSKTGARVLYHNNLSFFLLLE